MSTPYVGFSNSTLSDQLPMRKGDTILCPHCNSLHTIMAGTEKGQETDLLLFFECGEKLYLAGVSGRSVMGVKSDVSGRF